MSEEDFKHKREQMVREQIQGRGIRDTAILEVFRAVPRHAFVPGVQQAWAYADCPLPIGHSQTISQPYMVALMTQVLQARPGMKVLEVGTGSGYQAAILSALGLKVYSVERIAALAEQAEKVLAASAYRVRINIADGTLGWPEHAPYDRIMITAAAPQVPEALIAQLPAGGRLVVPLGGRFSQELTVISKDSTGSLAREEVCGCMFVPLLGKYGYKK